jgi:hypothetical protein
MCVCVCVRARAGRSYRADLGQCLLSALNLRDLLPESYLNPVLTCLIIY